MSADCLSVRLSPLFGFTAGIRIRIPIYIHIQIAGRSNKRHGPKLNLCLHYVCHLPLSLPLSPTLSLSFSFIQKPPLTPMVKERCRNCVTLFVSNFNKFARHLWPFVQIFNLFLGRSLPLSFSRAFVVCLC